MLPMRHTASTFGRKDDDRTTARISQFVAFAIAVAVVTLLISCAASVRWRYQHDSPLMIYAGWLVAQGAVPYRDFFDMNMPGTYLVMRAMGAVFGWNDFGVRLFDLSCLASISVSTFVWMRRFGTVRALAASCAFPLWYLGHGPSMSLQREYLALVPFAWALAIALPVTHFSSVFQILLAGLLTAATILIKPQFLLPCLPILIVLLQRDASTITAWGRAVALAAGMVGPVAATFLYLLWTESLRPFLDIATNYWPLYSHMTGDHQPIDGFQRLTYLVKSTRNGLDTFWFPLAIVGLIVLYGEHAQRRYVLVLGSILLAGAIYPAIAGQFWPYH